MRRLEDTRHLRHHAFVIEAEAEEGIQAANAWATQELGMSVENNPDVTVLRYGLFSVEDARRVNELAAVAPFVGDHNVLIIAASRAYHEAQNALLKLFEEPPPDTYLFLILPTLGGLLPTLRSRVATLDVEAGKRRAGIPEIARTFIEATKEKRSARIKKLVTGGDEEERREHRDEAITIVNGIETAAYERWKEKENPVLSALLRDLGALRSYLYDRSAPMRMILEHLSLVTPKDLL